MAQGGRTTKEEVTSARRAEARYTQLQPVRKDFYAATADLVRRTRADRDKAQGGDDFALSMLIANLNSIQSSATDVLKMRLSKIARMAVASAFKTDVPLDDLTAEEHEYFERVRALAKDMLNSFERECGMKTYSPQKIDVYTAPQTAPDVPVTAPSVPVTAPSSVPETAPGPSPEVPAEEMFEDPDMLDGGLMDDGDIPVDDFDAVPPEPKPEFEEPENRYITVRMFEDFPQFVGPDDRNYTLHREDVANLPEAVANILISSGKCAAVKYE